MGGGGLGSGRCLVCEYTLQYRLYAVYLCTAMRRQCSPGCYYLGLRS